MATASHATDVGAGPTAAPESTVTPDAAGAADGDSTATNLMEIGAAFASRYGLMREARVIGGAMITILLIAVVLNEVFGAVDVGDGPFSSIGNDLTTTGVAAVGLLVVGLIVVAANAILNMFGAGF